MQGITFVKLAVIALEYEENEPQHKTRRAMVRADHIVAIEETLFLGQPCTQLTAHTNGGEPVILYTLKPMEYFEQLPQPGSAKAQANE